MVRTHETPALVLRGAAAERATRVARWRDESRRNKPWLRVRTRVLIAAGLSGLGLVAIPFFAGELGSWYDGLGQAIWVLFLATLLALVLLSSILTNRGPSWIPRMGLAFTGVHLAWQLGQLVWPAANGSLAQTFGDTVAGATLALVLASQVTFFELPRHLVWIRVLAWGLIVVGGITLAQSGADLAFHTFMWLGLLALGTAWSVAYVSIVSAIRLTWLTSVRKARTLQPIGLWASILIFSLAWPTFALLLAGLENPLSSSSEGPQPDSARLTIESLQFGCCLLLGTAFACMWLFSIPNKSSAAQRPPHPASKAE